MKHIVQIIPALGYGGAERLVVDLINNSDSAKYRFSVIVFFDNIPLKTLIEKKAEVILVEKNSKLDFNFLNRLEKQLTELKPDLVHGHLFAGDFWGRLAAHRIGVPYLSTEHNLNHDDGCLKNFIKKIVSNKKDYYVACSEAVAGYMRRVYNIKNEITVIRNGIDLNRFASLAPSAWQIPLNFLMVGRLVKQKGHLVALSALNNLKNYPWKLRIVGSGKEKKNLQKFVMKNDLSTRVTFVDPLVKVEKYFGKSDVLLMPSVWEGLGVVVMEAMASGRVVLCSKTGGLVEIIKNNETGYLAQPKNIADWEEKIKYIFENKDECQRVTKNAQKYAKENFGIEKMVEKYGEIYSLVINRFPLSRE
ncbi:MAG: glycosyltransferase family 4 protein [Candidatus Magasanikbacteria bacterium]